MLPKNIEQFKKVLTEEKFNALLADYNKKIEQLKLNPKVKAPAGLAYNNTFGKYKVLLEAGIKPGDTKKPEDPEPKPKPKSKDSDNDDDYYY